MLSKRQELRRNVVEFLTLEDRIPRGHLLRKIDGAIDFGHLYDFVDMKSLYMLLHRPCFFDRLRAGVASGPSVIIFITVIRIKNGSVSQFFQV